MNAFCYLYPGKNYESLFKILYFLIIKIHIVSSSYNTISFVMLHDPFVDGKPINKSQMITVLENSAVKAIRVDK